MVNSRVFAGVLLLVASTVTADTLELADGTLLEGDFVGSSNGIIMFDTGAGIEAFPESEVVGMFFSSGVETARASRAEAARQSGRVGVGASLVTRGSSINIPAGTILETTLAQALTVPQ